VALLCWLGATLAAYVACLRRLAPHPQAGLLALAFTA